MHGEGLSSNPHDRLIIALDVSSAGEALALVDRLDGRCRWVKIGMELFYATGRSFVQELQARNLSIFLDLKVHDIPNTAAAAVRSLASLNVAILTLHGAGGPAMLAAARAEAERTAGAPLLAAVTVLTSMDQGQLEASGVHRTPMDQVLRVAEMSLGSGLQALVASPLELRALRQRFGPAPVLIVPGIRPASASAPDDQRRTATPQQAMRDGASLLVVGRPITRSADPREAFDRVASEIADGMRTV